MRTIEEIRGRCRIEPGDKPGQEHWIWGGCYDKKKKGDNVYQAPVIRAPDFGRDPTGKQTWVQYGARAVYNIVHGRPPAPGRNAYSSCNVHGCVSPHCVRAMLPTTWGRHVRKDGRYAGHGSVRALRIWDEIGRKVSNEEVAKIMLDERPAPDVAKDYGIHPSTVHRYRRGERKQALGPFAGLVR